MNPVLHLLSFPCPNPYPVDPHLCVKGLNHKPSFQVLLKKVVPVRSLRTISSLALKTTIYEVGNVTVFHRTEDAIG